MDASADPQAPLPTAVHRFWKELDLESLRSRLDEQGLAVAAAQEASAASRRALAERTREFKRAAPAELLAPPPGAPGAGVGPLLRAYQEEVDRLTARAKAAEASFLGLYKALYEAPDPAPALGGALAAATRAAELEARAAKLAGELAEYRAEAKGLKNQDLTIRRLEEKVRSLEAAVAERDRAAAEGRREAEAAARAAAEAEAEQRAAALAGELDQARAAHAALARLLAATQGQVMAVQARGEEAAEAVRAELELAGAEAERLRERLGQLEALERGGGAAGARELAAAEPAAGAAAAAASAAAAAEAAALRRELAAHREAAARAAADADEARAAAAAAERGAAARLDAARSALAAKEAHAAALEAELAGRPTAAQVEALRAKVRLLEAVGGLGAVEDDDDEGEPGGGAGAASVPAGAGAGGEGQRSALEAALMAKARRLEHDLTAARLEAAAARGDADAAAARAAEAEAATERGAALVARLEADLLAAERAGGGALSPANGESAAQDGGEPDMVSVLAGQRDRLRARVGELEAAAAGAAADAAAARADAAAARADAVALVERLRFVQGYRAQAGGGLPGAAGNDLEAASAAAVEGKYARDYEERVNPFSEFRVREREARRAALPVQDRAALAVSALLLGGSRAARSVLLAYALALHVGVFLVLAGASHRHADGLEALDELCAQKAAGAAGAAGAGDATESIDPVMGDGAVEGGRALLAAAARLLPL